MEIIDNMRRKVRDATLTALKVSSDLIEITKLNMAISSEEAKIKSLMLDMGKVVYESYKEGETIEAGLAAICEEISQAEMNIEDMKEKILEIKRMKQCSECSSEMDEDDAYCPKCGKKVENEPEDEDDGEQAEEDEVSETAAGDEEEIEDEDSEDEDFEEDEENEKEE